MLTDLVQVTLLSGSTVKNVRRCPLWWKDIESTGAHELTPVVEGVGTSESKTAIQCKCGVRGPWAKDAVAARDLWNDLPR